MTTAFPQSSAGDALPTPDSNKRKRLNQTPSPGKNLEALNVERRLLREQQVRDIIQEYTQPMQEELEFLKRENRQLKADLTKLEGYSRRKNLKFIGCRELPKENNSDVKNNLLAILREVGLAFPPKAIEFAHRVGQRGNRPRMIIATLFHNEEKDAVLRKKYEIKSRFNIIVDEDFPIVVEKKRNELSPIMIAANEHTLENGQKPYKAFMASDRLILNGKTYHTDTTKQLPEVLQPRKVCTPTKGEVTAFFTRASPLSNQYLAQQKLNGKTFNCNEQFYFHSKAVKFGDISAAEKILKEINPAMQKRLGGKIVNYNADVWDNCKLDIMTRGIQAKFRQNEELSEFLLGTGSTMMLEANPHDRYWGIGMSLRNPKIWIKNSWVGDANNHLGKILHDVRREIRRAQHTN